MGTAHNKLLRGRKLVVTFAQQAPVDPGAGSMGSRNRKVMTDSGRPTTLSMIKSGLGNRNEGSVPTRTRQFLLFIHESQTQNERQDRDDGGEAAADGKVQAHTELRQPVFVVLAISSLPARKTPSFGCPRSLSAREREIIERAAAATTTQTPSAAAFATTVPSSFRGIQRLERFERRLQAQHHDPQSWRIGRRKARETEGEG